MVENATNNNHSNARRSLSPAEKGALARAVRDGKVSESEAASRAGVTSRTVRKWVDQLDPHAPTSSPAHPGVNRLPPDSPRRGVDDHEELLANMLLDKQDLLGRIVSESEQRVYEKMRRDENRWRILQSAVVGLLLFIGYSTLVEFAVRPIREELKGHVEATVNAELQDAVEDLDTRIGEFEANTGKRVDDVEKRTSAIEKQSFVDIPLIKMARLAEALAREGRESFSNVERDEIMKQFEDLASIPEVQQQQMFLSAVEKAIDTFASASLDSYLDRMDDLAHDQLVGSVGMAQTLVEHYGRLLIGNPLGVAGWEGELERFQSYARAVRVHKFPEVALPFELLVEFMRSGRAAHGGLDWMMKQPTYWSVDERVSVIMGLVRLTRSRFTARTPSLRTEVIAEVSNQFLDIYQPQLMALCDDPKVVVRLLAIADELEERSLPLAIELRRVAAREGRWSAGSSGPPSGHSDPSGDERVLRLLESRTELLFKEGAVGTDQEFDFLIDALRGRIAVGDVEPEVDLLLELYIDQLVSVEPQRVDEIDDAIGDYLRRLPGVVLSLAQHYSNRIIVESGSNRSVQRRLDVYLRAADHHGLAEVVQPYALLAKFAAGGSVDNDDLRDEIEGTKGRDIDGQSELHLRLLLRANAPLTDDDVEQAVRLQENAQAFLTVYAEPLAECLRRSAELRRSLREVADVMPIPGVGAAIDAYVDAAETEEATPSPAADEG